MFCCCSCYCCWFFVLAAFSLVLIHSVQCTHTHTLSLISSTAVCCISSSYYHCLVSTRNIQNACNLFIELANWWSINPMATAPTTKFSDTDFHVANNISLVEFYKHMVDTIQHGLMTASLCHLLFCLFLGIMAPCVCVSLSFVECYFVFVTLRYFHTLFDTQRFFFFSYVSLAKAQLVYGRLVN